MTSDAKRLYDRNYYKKNKETYKVKSAKRMMKYRRTSHGKFKSYQNNSKSKKQEWEISYAYFCNIINSNCFYCKSNINIGIDRAFNELGYIYGNCVPCCTDCNLMKNKRDIFSFLNKCKIINLNSW